MAIRVVYKEKHRSYCQTQLDDWIPWLHEVYHERHLAMIEWRWELKKAYYKNLPAFLKKNLPPLRRGRIYRDYPTRKVYRMDIPHHVAEVKAFKWFTRVWHQNRQDSKPETPANQLLLDRWIPAEPTLKPAKHTTVVPRFRRIRVVDRDEFCKDITNLGWAALHQYKDSPACLFYIFYLNDFSIVDDEKLLESASWREIGAYLPSDIVKYEIARLMLGFTTFVDYLRMTELYSSFEDQLSIAMACHPPKADRLAKALRLIGPTRIRQLHEALKAECRALGLIKDKVWLWDGQFFEVWMKNERKTSSRNNTELYGGWYNHGGKKRGFGIVQSTIVDWSGYVPLPISIHVFPANTNENVMFRETLAKCVKENPKSAWFLDTDKGPTGYESIELVSKLGMVPVMALGKNRTRNVTKTKLKKYKFDAPSTCGIDQRVLEIVYMMRTRIEEIFTHVKVVFKQARLHGSSHDFLEVEVLLVGIAIMLIALTAFKIGKPELAWRPTAFNNMRMDPEDVFPERMNELKKLRWVDIPGVK
nr:transposase [Candidatus Sigynarchaeota archaeon]